MPAGRAVERPAVRLGNLEDGQAEYVLDIPLRALRLDGYLLFVFPDAAANNYSVMCIDLTQAESP